MGQRGGKNLLDRMAYITDGKWSATDGTKRQFCAEVYETGLQAPDPGSEAVRIPSATSGSMPILT